MPSFSKFRRLGAYWISSTAAIGFVLAGCQSADSTASRESKRGSIQTSGVTRIDPKMQNNVMNFPTGSGESSVLRVEQVTPREVRAGVPYNYQVKVTNLTDQPLQGVTLRASRPEGLRLDTPPAAGPTTQPSAMAAASDGWMDYNIGALGPRETRTFTMSGTPTGQGVVRQTYDVRYQQSMSTAVNVTAPAVAVTKQGPSDVDVCQEIVWNYAVRNTGSGVARNVRLEDRLPEGLTTTDGQPIVSVDLKDIPGGESRTATARLKAAHSGTFASAATVRSDAGEAKSEAVTTVARQPVLDVTIQGPDKEYLGKQVTYKIVVSNKGDAAAQAATLRLQGAEEAKIVGVADTAGTALLAAAGGEGGNDLGVIEPGQSKSITATLEPSRGGVLNVNAVANARCATRVSKGASTQILTVAALLLEAVDSQDPVKVGENVVYRIKVTNQGNGPDSNVKVTATLPDGQQFISAGGATPAVANGQTITFNTVPAIAPKESVNWEITAKATKASDVQFKVTATSDAVKVPAEKTEATKLY